MNENIQKMVSANPAIEMLAQLDRGRVIAALAEKYPQVVDSVRRTGKKGELVLKLTISPEGKGEVTTVEVAADVKVKLPEKGVKATTFFIEPDSNLLVRDDPKQADFFEGEAPGQAKAKATAAR